LPAWISIPVHEAELPATLTMLHAQDLMAYGALIVQEVQPVVEAPLHLHCTDRSVSMTAFRAPFSTAKEHYAIRVSGDRSSEEPPLVRLHSSCYTGDLLGSLTCDCGEQMQSALAKMGEDPAGGILIYIQQEGRGIGLINKLRCYHEQSDGMDTVDANLALGFPDDAREFEVAALILKQCGVQRIRLLSNNPGKMAALRSYGIDVVACLPHIVEGADHPLTQRYMQVKKERLGHRLP
jgi:GTP cyclohydrolase II